MGMKENVRGVYQDDPDFQALKPEEQEAFLTDFTSTKKTMESYLESEPDFQALSEEEKAQTRYDLAPEFYEAPKLEQGMERPRGVIPQEHAFEDLPPDLQAARMASTSPTPEQYFQTEETMQDLGAAIPRSLDEPATQAANALLGRLSLAAGGTVEALADFSAPGMRFRAPGTSPAEMVKDTVASLRDYGKKQIAQSEEYATSLNAMPEFAYRAGVELLDSVPTLMGTIAGGFIPAMGIEAVKAMTTRYGEMKEAGYEPYQAAAGASVSGVAMGALGAFSAANALSVGKPMAKKFLQASLIDFGGSAAAQSADLTASYLFDKFAEGVQTKLIPEDMDFNEAIKQVAYNSLVNFAAGVVPAHLPDLYHRAMLDAQGLQAVDHGGQVAVMTKESAQMFEGIKQFVPTRADGGKVDLQAFTDNFTAAFEAQKEKLANLADIEARQSANPLRSRIGGDAQRGPLTQPKYLKVGQEVGVHPRVFEGQTSDTLSEAMQGKLSRKISEPEIGEDGKPTGKKINKYEIVLDSGLTRIVDRKDVVIRPKIANLGAEEIDAPSLVQLSRDLFNSGNAMADNTPEQNRIALGGLLGIAKSGMGRGALGMANPKSGYAGMVFDAMANNPKEAAHIFSHEVGHFLFNLDPAVAKRWGMPDRESLQGFLGKANDDLSAQNMKLRTDYVQYLRSGVEKPVSRDEWMMSAKYGGELQQMWDMWALYPEKLPSSQDMVANALSLFLHDAAGKKSGPTSYDYRNSKFYGEWKQYLNDNPEAATAIDSMVLNSQGNKDRGVIRTMENIALGDRAEVLARKRQSEMGYTTEESLANSFYDSNYALLKALKNDPKAVDQIDASLLHNAKAAVYVAKTVAPVYKYLVDNSLPKQLFGAYMELNRIVKDRETWVSIIKDPEAYDSMDSYQRARAIAEREARQSVIDDNPAIDDFYLGRQVKAIMDEFDADNVVKQKIALLNPDGLTVETAKEQIAQIDALYGEGTVAKFEEFRANMHKQKTDHIVQALKDGKQYTPEQIQRIEDNKDYATFNVVWHGLAGTKKFKGRLGSVGEMYRQMGTLGVISDPFAATVDKMVRMATSSKRAETLNNMLEALVTADTYQEQKDAYVVTKNQDEQYPAPKSNAFELVTTHKYIQDRFVETAFMVRKPLLDGFKNHLTDLSSSAVISGLSQIHNYIKPWLTVYNPSFWFKNVFRDIVRTAVNLPGLSAMYKIPYLAAKEGLSDLYNTQYMGKENPHRTELLNEDALLGGGRYTDVDVDQTLLERQFALSGGGITKAYKDLSGMAEHVKYAAEFAVGKWKQFATAVGESSEFASKAAADTYLKQAYPKMPPEARLYLVRNMAGTPLLSRHGNYNKLMSNMFMFYNPNVQGLAADIKGMNAETIFKRMLATVPYQIGVAYALSGDDPERKDWARRVPVRAWKNSFVIPLGYSADGKAAYISLPMDQGNSFVNSAIFNVATKLTNDQYSFGDIGADFFTQIDEAGVSLTPAISTPLSVIEMLSKGNTKDFAGRDVINPKLAASDDTASKVWEGVKFVMNTGFGGPVTSFYRFPYNAGGKEYSGKDGERRLAAKTLSMVQEMTGLPGLQSLVGLVKFSDAGIAQWNAIEESAALRRDKSEKNAVGLSVEKIKRGEKLTREELMNLAKHEGTFNNSMVREGTIDALSWLHPTLAAYQKAVNAAPTLESKLKRQMDMAEYWKSLEANK